MNEIFWAIVIICMLVVLSALESTFENHEDPLDKKVGREPIPDDDIVYVDLELHDATIYAFDAITGAFVCQASTIDGIRIAFIEKFPRKNCFIVKADDGATRILEECGYKSIGE